MTRRCYQNGRLRCVVCVCVCVCGSSAFILVDVFVFVCTCLCVPDWLLLLTFAPSTLARGHSSSFRSLLWTTGISISPRFSCQSFPFGSFHVVTRRIGTCRPRMMSSCRGRGRTMRTVATNGSECSWTSTLPSTQRRRRSTISRKSSPPSSRKSGPKVDLVVRYQSTKIELRGLFVCLLVSFTSFLYCMEDVAVGITKKSWNLSNPLYSLLVLMPHSWNSNHQQASSRRISTVAGGLKLVTRRHGIKSVCE